MAAVRSAGELKNREYLNALIRALGNSRLRGDAITRWPASARRFAAARRRAARRGLPVRMRRQIPRVLKQIRDQRAVDVLVAAVGHRDLTIRAAVLKALNRLRETAPELNFDNHFVSEQFWQEARYYYELSAALSRSASRTGGRPRHLLARTIEERLKGTLERLFRLLGLRYPPRKCTRRTAPCRARTGGGDRRAGVPGQHAGAGHQAHPAAAAGRAGAPARARAACCSASSRGRPKRRSAS